MTPFILIGKEIERRSQEGEDISLLDNRGPRRYQAGQKAKTRAADGTLVRDLKPFTIKAIVRESGVSRYAVRRVLHGERVHPRTRMKLREAVKVMKERRS